MSKAVETPTNSVAAAVVAAAPKKKQPYPFWLGGTSIIHNVPPDAGYVRSTRVMSSFPAHHLRTRQFRFRRPCRDHRRIDHPVSARPLLTPTRVAPITPSPSSFPHNDILHLSLPSFAGPPSFPCSCTLRHVRLTATNADTDAACSPLDLTKVRMQATGDKGMVNSLRKTVRTAGVRGLFDGISGTWFRQMTYSVCRFWAYDESKKLIGAGECPPFLSLLNVWFAGRVSLMD